MSYQILTPASELCIAKDTAKALLVDSIITEYIQKLFLLTKVCGNGVGAYCLFLYSYALDNHEIDGQSLLSPEQLNAITLKLERINSCCHE